MNQDEMLKALEDLNTPITLISPNDDITINHLGCDSIEFYGITLRNAITELWD